MCILCGLEQANKQKKNGTIVCIEAWSVWAFEEG